MFLDSLSALCCLNLRPQSGNVHSKGFSSVCVRICWSSACLALNLNPQMLHFIGLSASNQNSPSDVKKDMKLTASVCLDMSCQLSLLGKAHVPCTAFPETLEYARIFGVLGHRLHMLLLAMSVQRLASFEYFVARFPGRGVFPETTPRLTVIILGVRSPVVPKCFRILAGQIVADQGSSW